MWVLITEVAYGQGVPQFVDVAREMGIGFRHVTGESGRKYAVEPFGAGLALFDYDGDGDLDVYFVNGGPLPGYKGEAIRPGALYRNDGRTAKHFTAESAESAEKNAEKIKEKGEKPLTTHHSPLTTRSREAEGGIVFTDVTAQAGLTAPGYGMGCCVGDYDNDGHPDLYVTNFGANVLYHNNGDGTFTDVTKQAGVEGGLWNTGCAFADVNGDGRLDLFVAGYVRYRFDDPRMAGFYLIPYLPASLKNKSLGELRLYPDPVNFDPLSDVLYLNEGPGRDGVYRFADVTRQAGIVDDGGRSLGVVFFDYDNDGDADLYVANDETRNTLYRNEGKGEKTSPSPVAGERRLMPPPSPPAEREGDRGRVRSPSAFIFTDVTLFAGVGYDEHGRSQASMGVDVGDYDGDGRLDLITTNFQGEHTTLYHNDGGGFFSDVSYATGVGTVTRPYVSWGVAFFDYDNDGDLDLLNVTGHLQSEIERIDPTTTYPQPTLLLRNDGGTFTDVSATSGPGLRPRRVGRGAAVGDFDEDGDLDVFIQTLDRTAVLLRNDGGNKNHWIEVKLVGGQRGRGAEGQRSGGAIPPAPPLPRSPAALSNRSAIGAKVRVVAGGLTQVREVKSGASYLSQSDLRLHFGLGQSRRADLVEVQWPSGAVQRLRDVAVDQIVIIQEGVEDRRRR